jgi:uncharacterized protein YjbJ (UPF0337 family)
MNERIEAAPTEPEGDRKTDTGKVTGGEELKADAHGDRIVGTIRNAAGRVEDAAGPDVGRIDTAPPARRRRRRCWHPAAPGEGRRDRPQPFAAATPRRSRGRMAAPVPAGQPGP